VFFSWVACARIVRTIGADEEDKMHARIMRTTMAAACLSVVIGKRAAPLLKRVQ